MLALHALKVLDHDETSALEDHLPVCAECRTELDRWHETVGVMTYATEPLEPSPQVRDRILASVRAEKGLAPAAKVVLPRPERRTPAAWLPRFGALAACLLLIVSSVVTVVLWRRNRQARIETERLAAQNEQLRKASERDQKLVELLRTPGVRFTELSPTKDSPGARALLAFDPKSGRAILTVDGLPPAAPGKAYQLWFIVDNVALPGRVFASDQSGKSFSDEQLPPAATQTAVFAITQENVSGATTPTGPILLRSLS